MRKLTWTDTDKQRKYYVDGELYVTIDLVNLTDEIHYKLVNEFMGI